MSDTRPNQGKKGGLVCTGDTSATTRPRVKSEAENANLALRDEIKDLLEGRQKMQLEHVKQQMDLQNELHDLKMQLASFQPPSDGKAAKYDAVLDFDLVRVIQEGYWSIPRFGVALQGKMLGVLGNYSAGKTFFMSLLTGQKLPDQGDLCHTVGLSLKQTLPHGQGEDDWDPEEKFVVLDTAGRNAPVSFALEEEQEWTFEFLELQREQDEFYRDVALTLSNMCFMVVNHITQDDVKYIHEIAKARNQHGHPITIMHNFKNVRTPEELLEAWKMVCRCFRPFSSSENKLEHISGANRQKIYPLWSSCGEETRTMHIPLVANNGGWGGRYNVAAIAKVREVIRNPLSGGTSLVSPADEGMEEANAKLIADGVRGIIDRYIAGVQSVVYNETDKVLRLVPENPDAGLMRAKGARTAAQDKSVTLKPLSTIFASSSPVKVVAMKKEAGEGQVKPVLSDESKKTLEHLFPTSESAVDTATQLCCSDEDVQVAQQFRETTREELILRLAQFDRVYAACGQKPVLVESPPECMGVDVCPQGRCAFQDYDVMKVKTDRAGYNKIVISGKVASPSSDVMMQEGMKTGYFEEEFYIPVKYSLASLIRGSDETGSVFRAVFGLEEEENPF